MPYERTYRGLPMIGGDFVVVVDPTGRVSTTSVALTHAVKDVAREPRLTPTEAQKIAAAQEKSPETGREPEAGGELVVYALGDTSQVAWRVDLPGRRLCRCVDGRGADLFESTPTDWTPPDTIPTCEQVDGSGTGYYNGPVSIAVEFCRVTASSSFYLLADPRSGLICGSQPTNEFFTDNDPHFGNGTLSDPETQCVDAMFAGQTQLTMLGDWLGRNGLDNQGGAVSIWVGPDRRHHHHECDPGGPRFPLPTAADHTGPHRAGHGTGRRPHNAQWRVHKGTREFIADAFGIATEFYANESEPFDVPDGPSAK